MSVFADIIGHEPIIRVLNHALTKPAHGYLFCGPRGAGKGSIAERFAAGLLLGPDASSFHEINTHPDFIRIAREEGAREIVVKQARELLTRMQLTSARGGYKIALIEEADRLNEEAANALLKAVEEPSPNTVYLFLAEQPDRLPATLRSRLVKMEFGRVPTKGIEDWLSKQGEKSQVKAQDIHDIAIQSRGCPGTAFRLAFASEDIWYQDVDWQKILDVLLAPPFGKQLAAIETLTKTIESQGDPETAWHEALDHLMRGLDTRFANHPAESVRLAEGLSRAWSLVGSAISPRLAIEYALVPTESKQGRMIPRILS